MNVIKNHFSGNFTIIPNALIEDKTLSDRSRFLYVFLVHKPKDWIFRTNHLSKSLGMHTDTFRKYRKELSDKGWIKIEDQEFVKGRFTSKIYNLYETPFDLKKEQELDNLDSQEDLNIPSQKKNSTDKYSGCESPTPSNTNSNKKNKNDEINKDNFKQPKKSVNQNPNPRK